MSAWTVYDLIEVDRLEKSSKSECLEKADDNAPISNIAASRRLRTFRTSQSYPGLTPSVYFSTD